MTHKSFAALDALAQGSGYELVDPPILQPADLFLDLLGEDMRRRAFLTTDAEGREFLLRPDFTIPVSLQHLQRAAADGVGAYAYRGPVFRSRQDGTGEILQAGFESFGRLDVEAADAEMLGMAVDAAAALGLAAPEVRMGDAGLIAALLERLDLPPVWRRRLATDLQRSRNLDEDLARLGERSPRNGAATYAGFLAALEGSDSGAARSAVADLLSIAGIQPVGGRSVDEIADRFLEQASLGTQTALPGATRALIERFLSISGDPDKAAGELRVLANGGLTKLAAALDLFESRTGFLAARGVDLSRIAFATRFFIGLDYYTGFEFRLHDPSGRVDAPLDAGGRYDKLLSRLGSATPIPAVGLGVWIERLAGRGGAA
jgi:ATP phosphoribosyltransferase regulatory subunit